MAALMKNTPEQGFEDSRRLTGPNLYFSTCGAALEVLGGVTPSDESLLRWKNHVLAAFTHLGWASPEVIIRKHCTGCSLVFSAPIDQLYAATEVNEWAWLKAIDFSQTTYSPASPNLLDEISAYCTLKSIAAAEANPALIILLDVAKAKKLPTYVDDEFFSIGEGQTAQTWAMDALPSLNEVDWKNFSRIPIALITGSNGKTTTTRLVAAMCREQGWHTGHNCTDGLFLDGVCYEEGDYSGPMGARSILRNKNVQAGILETARGGILRRGLAVHMANVAAVINISEDHFGEYGIHDLSALAEVKLTVARALNQEGVLVLNADDEVLMQKAEHSDQHQAYFSLEENNWHINTLKAHGGTVCEMRNDHLYLNDIDLGDVMTMPLSMKGTAKYNIQNLAAAACIAFCLGVHTGVIKTTMQSFGALNTDNPGRLQRWQISGVTILSDYAHNPDGLQGFLSIVKHLQTNGRLALLLGQAGNREDKDIKALAKVAASFNPDLIVLKDIDGYERGRAAGEVPEILRSALTENGISFEHILVHLDEVEAVRSLLAWSRPGDVLALPIHSTKGRVEVEQLLHQLMADQWCTGDQLPPRITHALETHE
jgi:cyanophycin synthetase